MSNLKGNNWPECPNCDGNGTDYGETCAVCGGIGRDPRACEQCEGEGVAFNDDGEFLCGECLENWAVEEGYSEFEIKGQVR